MKYMKKICNVKYNVYYIFANRIYVNVKLLFASENRREASSDFPAISYRRHFQTQKLSEISVNMRNCNVYA